jgi:acyl carrier protein
MSEDLNARLKVLIIEALMFEDMEPADIKDDAPLFGDGLGLDSVDALELAVEMERVFGVTIPQSDETRAAFQSVNTLAAYITAHREAL